MIRLSNYKKSIEVLSKSIIILISIYSTFYLLFILTIYIRHCPIPFESESWIAEREISSRYRYYRNKMRSDLVGNHLYEGMTKSEVKSLLGEPAKKYRWEVDDPRFKYEIGHISMFGLDQYALFVEFDDSDQITEFYIAERY